MIKRKAMVYFIGQMAENTMASGEMENKMELVLILAHLERLKEVNGKREKE